MSDAADAGMSPERAHGLAMMTEVYGFDMSDGPGDYFAETADHLFGRIWSRPEAGTGPSRSGPEDPPARYVQRRSPRRARSAR